MGVELERARTLLGVDASADADTVRRAYLRAIKKTKPERDPEGFKQIREAYELAAAYAGLETPRFEQPLPAPELDPEESERWKRFDELDAQLAGAPAPERIAALEEAVEADASNAELRHWLFDELCDAGRETEAVELAREAIDAGAPDFVPVLAHRQPSALTDAELDQVAEYSPDAVVRELLERERDDDARALALRSVERGASEDYPYLRRDLDNVLAFVAAGDDDGASEILAKLRDAVARLGIGARISEHDKLHLLLVGELVAVAADVELELSEPLAEALLDGVLEDAERHVRAFAIVDMEGAERAQRILERRAPALADIVGPWLGQRVEAPPPATYSKGVPWALLVTAFLAIGVVRGAVRSCNRSSSYEMPALPSLPERLNLAPAAPAVAELCAAAPDACMEAHRLSRELEAGDCDNAMITASELHAAVENAPQIPRPEAQAAMQDLLARYSARCSGGP